MSTSLTAVSDPPADHAARSRQLAAALLLDARRCWIGTHVDPDGDAIGSLLGLGRILSDMGKTVVCACQDPVPPEVAFLPGVTEVGTTPPTPGDVIVALDVADRSRLGTLIADDVVPDLVIDHHISNRGFGRLNVIEPEAASTAEVVVRLADQLGAPIGPAAATCLLTGIVTDTLGFRTTNTTPTTLDTACQLIRLGAPLAEITHRVFTRPLATLRLAALAIERLEMHGPFALTALGLADLAELGVPPSAVRGITMLLSGAAEPAALAVLRERPDGAVDVSLRSKPGVDLVPAAAALGGGGHPQAAGAKVPGPLEDATRAVLAALQDHVTTTDGAAAAGAPPAG